jgi:hypothetical protein
MNYTYTWKFVRMLHNKIPYFYEYIRKELRFFGLLDCLLYSYSYKFASKGFSWTKFTVYILFLAKISESTKIKLC